ncbi:MAG: PAS domain-containing protein, partial [Bdellovibrionota bacterium]
MASNPKHKGRFSVLTLKSRLLLVFAGLLISAITFCGVLLMQQHRIAMKGAMTAIRAHDDMVDAMELRESLSEVDRQARLGEFSTNEISHFRRVLSKISESVASRTEFQNLLSEIDQRFNDYVSGLNGSRGANAQQKNRANFEDVMASVGAFIDLSQNSVYGMAQNLRAEQERSTRYAFLFLSIFILITAGTGFKLISTFTQPLTSLARFLDNVDVEDHLPSRVPPLDTMVPEITLVTSKLEQLMDRLRGYRALNVRRLLIEKRRADIIAASIADGIFLLRGEEILYANPTAERILGMAAGNLPKGLRLSSLGRAPDRTDISQINRGAEALLTAVSRTIPVEFVQERDDRKYYYLLQAYPI